MPKKLTKKQSRSVAIVLAEQTSVPLLILATSVVFTLLGVVEKSAFGIRELSILTTGVLGIIILSCSIFCKRAIRIFDESAELNVKWLGHLETIGVALSVVSFFGLISLVSKILAVILFVLSFAVWLFTVSHVNKFIGKIRRE